MEADKTALMVIDLNRSLPLRKLDDLIDRLDMSADAKALMRDIGRLSVRIGREMVNIGRKILTLAAEICKKFPNTMFGIVVTVAISLLLGVMGPFAAVLAPILTPLMLIFAVTKGMMADFAHATWAGTLRDLERKIAALSPHETR